MRSFPQCFVAVSEQISSREDRRRLFALICMMLEIMFLNACRALEMDGTGRGELIWVFLPAARKLKASRGRRGMLSTTPASQGDIARKKPSTRRASLKQASFEAGRRSSSSKSGKRHAYTIRGNTDRNMPLSQNVMTVSSSHSKAALLTTCRIWRVMKMLAMAYSRLLLVSTRN